VAAVTDVREISRIDYGFHGLSRAVREARFDACEVTRVVPGTTRLLSARR
jgi:hypothetical protein